MTFSNALHIAGANDKMNIVNFSIDPEEKYTIGVDNGRFLSGTRLFRTDQSKCYLSGRSVRESQMGLIMNGLLKCRCSFLYY
jgi:hypothetical protein